MSTGVSMVADVLRVKSNMSTGVSTVADLLRVRFNATITCIMLGGELYAAQVESVVSPASHSAHLYVNTGTGKA